MRWRQHGELTDLVFQLSDPVCGIDVGCNRETIYGIIGALGLGRMAGGCRWYADGVAYVERVLTHSPPAEAR